MDSQVAANFERLKVEQERYLKLSNDRISQWNKYKQDYEILRGRLETLPNELRYPIMVPISKVAFMPGRLVNTNEILVLLGDNWFVEKSAKQACELIDRRIKQLDTFLDDLTKENTIFRDQLNWTQNLMKEKNDYVNIEEKLDPKTDSKQIEKKRVGTTVLSEEEKRELRRKQQERAVQHQTKIDEYLKSSSKELLQSIEEARGSTAEETRENEEQEADNDNQKEIENDENLNDDVIDDVEFDRLVQEYDKSIDRKNNDEVRQRLEATKQPQRRRVKWQDKSENIRVVDDDEDEDDEPPDSDDYDDEDYDDNEENDEEEKFSSRSEPIVIKIKHTQNEKLTEIERNLAVSRDRVELNSPADIYSHFFKPKSILKTAPNRQESTSNSLFDSTAQIAEDEKIVEKSSLSKPTATKFEPHKAFSGEVVERPVLKTIQQQNQPTGTKPIELDSKQEASAGKKPVSRFKASKMNQ